MVSKNNLFSITDMNLEIFLNESSLINEIKQWLSVFDKHNLYKFLHPSHFYNIVSYLKRRSMCGGKIAFPVTLLLSILAFYQYFNWTDRTIFTDGFVDTMFNIDNDGCEALKNLTIENVKSAKGASDRCLKNPKCVAYNLEPQYEKNNDV